MDFDISQSPRAAVALILAVATYAGKYYYDFGQVCPAMWFGTYPPIFILVATATYFKLLSIPEAIEIGRRRKQEKEDEEYRQFLINQKQEDSSPPPPPRNRW